MSCIVSEEKKDFMREDKVGEFESVIHNLTRYIYESMLLSFFRGTIYPLPIKYPANRTDRVLGSPLNTSEIEHSTNHYLAKEVFTLRLHIRSSTSQNTPLANILLKLFGGPCNVFYVI